MVPHFNEWKTPRLCGYSRAAPLRLLGIKCFAWGNSDGHSSGRMKASVLLSPITNLPGGLHQQPRGHKHTPPTCGLQTHACAREVRWGVHRRDVKRHLVVSRFWWRCHVCCHKHGPCHCLRGQGGTGEQVMSHFPPSLWSASMIRWDVVLWDFNCLPPLASLLFNHFPPEAMIHKAFCLLKGANCRSLPKYQSIWHPLHPPPPPTPPNPTLLDSVSVCLVVHIRSIPVEFHRKYISHI